MIAKKKGTLCSELFEAVGFDGADDFVRHTIPDIGMKGVLFLSLSMSVITKIFGLPPILFLGLVFMLVLELITGSVVGVYYNNESWDSRKFYRFLFRSAVLFLLIAAINFLKIGFSILVQDKWYAKVVVDFSLDSLFLFFMFTMAWYIILSVVENMASTGSPFFLTLAKYLRVRIRRLESEADTKV